jgi:hypothetical protein
MRSALSVLGVLAVALTTGCAAATEETEADRAAASAPACLPALACAAPAGPSVARRPWRHPFSTGITVTLGDARHRGRDLFVNPGAKQTVIAKFAYGINDKDLKDEEVDVFVQRDCGSGWEKLGTAITTEEGAHATVEGVEDSGGRVYFEIPPSRHLGPGRHRVRLVVAGDGTTADVFIDVVPAGTPIFVSDVDGTLTSSEYVEFVTLLTGDLPETHAGAPEALRALAARGYRPMYLTARPEWLHARTHAFLAEHGFPPGIVHTSTSPTGAGIGQGAATFKLAEMAMLAKKGLVPRYAFGNKESDSQAYASVQPAANRIFFKIDEPFNGRKIDAYTELLPGFNALPALCSN